MKINKENYEMYFLDFLEGRLSSEEEKILNDFLKANPDLDDELKNFDIVRMPREKITMPSKEKLRKKIPEAGDRPDHNNFDLYAIACLEGDLDSEQNTLLEEFIRRNPEFEHHFECIKQSFLKPEALAYPNKEKLKKTHSRKFDLRILLPVAAAASIAFLLIFRTAPPVNMENQIAELPEAVVYGESSPKEPAVKKPSVREKASTVRIIKSGRKNLPLSSPPGTDKAAQNTGKENSSQKDSRQRLAAISLEKVTISEIPSFDMQLVQIPGAIPSINPGSLALTQRVRYELDRANELLDEEDVFIWNLASIGIEEINKRAGTNMELMASRDDNGELSGFSFRSNIFKITAPVSRESE